MLALRITPPFSLTLTQHCSSTVSSDPLTPTAIRLINNDDSVSRPRYYSSPPPCRSEPQPLPSLYPTHTARSPCCCTENNVPQKQLTEVKNNPTRLVAEQKERCLLKQSTTKTGRPNAMSAHPFAPQEKNTKLEIETSHRLVLAAPRLAERGTARTRRTSKKRVAHSNHAQQPQQQSQPHHNNHNYKRPPPATAARPPAATGHPQHEHRQGR